MTLAPRGKSDLHRRECIAMPLSDEQEGRVRDEDETADRSGRKRTHTSLSLIRAHGLERLA
jgi:hypothetical protein